MPIQGMTMTLLATLLWTSMASVLGGCTAPGAGDGSKSANVSQGTAVGGQGQPCATGAACEAGLVCRTDEVCVPPATILVVLQYFTADGSLADPPDGTQVQLVDPSKDELPPSFDVQHGYAAIPSPAAGSYVIKTAFFADPASTAYYYAEGAIDWDPRAATDLTVVLSATAQ